MVLLRLLLSTMAFVWALAMQAAAAQDFPSRVVRMILPNSPGTTPDILGRALVPDMARALGQPVIVENRLGAGQLVGYEYVAKQAPADGYTILLMTLTTNAILPITVKDLRFDPVKDIPSFINVSEGRLIFGSAPTFPWKTFAELVAHAKKNPGKLNYGASGPLIHLLPEVLATELGLDIVHVPYSASTAYFQAVMSGDVHMGFVSYADAVSWGAKFRPLAVTGDKRASDIADTPTFVELGFPQIQGVKYGLGAPAATPRPVIQKLHAAAAAALESQDVKGRLAKLHMSVGGGTPEAAAKTVADMARLFAGIAKKAGIQPQ